MVVSLRGGHVHSRVVDRIRLEGADPGPAARAGAANDAGKPDATAPAGGHVHAAGEGRVEGEEAGHSVGVSVKNARVWAAARARPSDDLEAAIPVHVAGGHCHSA